MVRRRTGGQTARPGNSFKQNEKSEIEGRKLIKRLKKADPVVREKKKVSRGLYEGKV